MRWAAWQIVCFVLFLGLVEGQTCRDTSVKKIRGWKDLERQCGKPQHWFPTQALEQLTDLRFLSLHGREWEGVWPESFHMLSKLTHLSLAGSKIPSLPDKLVQQLTNLETLDLSENELETLPESFSQLTLLKNVDISSNRLSLLPHALAQLSLLNKLRLYNNPLETLPEWFTASYPQLEELDLFNTETLKTLPQSFGALRALKKVTLWSNRFVSLPESFGQLSNLEEVDLSGNELRSIPSSIGGLTRCTSLSLSRNRLEILPDALGEMQALSSLQLETNLLHSLPLTLGQLSNLTKLSLQENKFKEFPDALLLLTQLVSLDMHRNRLQALPSTLNNLTTLEYLDLSENQLDFLPDTIGNLTQLKQIELFGNKLEALPSSIGTLPQLHSMTISKNPLVCDLASTHWLNTLEPSKITDKDDTQCNHVNEYGGFPVHRVRFVQDEPETHPSSLELSVASSSEIVFSWRYAPASDQYADDKKFDYSIIYDTFEFGTVYVSGGGMGSSFQSGRGSSYLGSDDVGTSTTYVTSKETPYHYSGYSNTTIQEDEDPYFTDQDFFHCKDLKSKQRKDSSPSLLFEVEYRPVLSDSWEKRCTWSFSILIANLAPDSTYEVRVRAVNVRWDVPSQQDYLYPPRFSPGPRSKSRRVKTAADIPTDTPRNVTSPTNHKRETSVSLQWDPPAIPNSDSIYYTVMMITTRQASRQLEKQDGDGIIIARDLVLPFFTVEGLQPGSKYEFRVRASSDVGHGNWTDIIETWTEPPCPLGFQRREDDGYSCVSCPIDTYRADVQTKECLKCPADRPQTLTSGSTNIQSCLNGAAFLKQQGETENRTIRAGYWRVSNMTHDFRSCPEPMFCTPEIPALVEEWNGSEQYCRPFHNGVFCSACEDGFAMKASGCEFCSEQALKRDQHLLVFWTIVGLIVVLAPPVLLIVHVVRLEAQREVIKSEKSATSKRCFECVPELAAMHIVEDLAVTLRVFLGFLQVCLQFVMATNLIQTGRGGWQVVVNLDIGALFRGIGTACAWSANFYDGLFLYTVFPLVSVALMFLIVTYMRASQSYLMYATALGFSVWTSLQLLFLVYPGVSSTVFESFRFEEFPRWDADPSPIRTLSSDYTIDYDTEESDWWKVYAGVMVAVYPIGVIFVFVAMVELGQHLESRETTTEAENAVRDSVGFLSRPYTWKYFECYELVRKLVMTSLFLLVRQATARGSEVFFLAIAVLFLTIVLSARPYKSQVNFLFASFSSLMLVAVGFVPVSEHMLTSPLVGEPVLPTGSLESLVFAILALEAVAFLLAIGVQIRQAQNMNARKKAKSETVQDDSNEPDASINDLHLQVE